jgi:uncharacterized protein YeaC (DUF1315 family)
MNDYYKESFKAFMGAENERRQHKSLSSMTKAEMEENLRQFIDHMFGPEVLGGKALTSEQKQQFVQSMMIFVFAHRHSKNDRFIEETRDALKARKNNETHFNFDIVRNVMYHYSKKAQDVFMQYPIECFFLAKFASSAEGIQYIEGKTDDNELKT